MKKYIILLSVLFALGCQSTANKIAGICQIETISDSFENSKKVNFTPCLVDAGKGISPSFKFSFDWDQTTPSRIGLGVTYDSNIRQDSYTNFESIAIKVDEDILFESNFGRTNLSSSGYNTVSNTIYTTSENRTVIPLELFDKMLKSDNVLIKVNSSDGYEDYFFHTKERGIKKYARFYIDEYYKTIKELK